VTATTVVELLGYLASGLIVLSLVMSSLLRLRVINLIGATVFALYGVLIGSVPVVVTNGAIVVINVVYLTRLLRDRSSDAYFEVVPIGTREPLLARFLAEHDGEIRAFQPAYTGLRDDHLAWFVLRDAVPVGVVLGRLLPFEAGAGSFHLDVDHVTAPHRDFSPGAVLFGHGSVLQDLPAERLTSAPGTAMHRRYLERMGFEEDGELLSRPLR
jgi:hypothetical protein